MYYFCHVVAEVKNVTCKIIYSYRRRLKVMVVCINPCN